MRDRYPPITIRGNVKKTKYITDLFVDKSYDMLMKNERGHVIVLPCRLDIEAIHNFMKLNFYMMLYWVYDFN